MDKYEAYKQELLRAVAYKEIDAFDLIDDVIDYCIKIDKQDEIISTLEDYIKELSWNG